MESDIRMGYSTRVDTLELKAQIFKKLGKARAGKYFLYLSRFFAQKISKSEFDRLCVVTIGKENVRLHNQLIRSVIKNACSAKTGPSNGIKAEGPPSIGKVESGSLGDVFNPSPRRVGSSCIRDRKMRDRRSPLGPQGKSNSTVCDAPTPKTQELQSATELFSPCSRPPVEVVSVEDGEEVEQMMGSPGIQSRTPLRAPLGVPTNMGGARKTLRSSFLTSFHMETCRNSYELPDTRSLMNRLVQKLEKEGLSTSMECVDLLNNGLDAYLKRLIKPCIELAGASCGEKQQNVSRGLNGLWSQNFVQRSTQPVSTSLLDFQVAMELKPQRLGEDWPIQLERICLRASEE